MSKEAGESLSFVIEDRIQSLGRTVWSARM